MQKKITFTQEADFRRERDFGAKVGATFDFVSAQFRPLLKCLAYFVLPGALLGGVGLGLAAGNFLNLLSSAAGRGGAGRMAQAYPSGANPFASGSSMLGLGLATLGFLAAFLLLTSTVYGFVRVRLRTPPGEVVQPAQVWAVVRRRLGHVVLAWLLLTMFSFLGFGLLSTVLTQAGPGYVLLAFFPLVWFVVCMTLYFPVLWMEDAGPIAAFWRTFYLIKGKWWSSLGLYLIMAFIAGMVQYIFILPFYGLMGARMLLHWPDSELLNVGAMSFYALGWIFTGVLPLLAMLFQYFNLVERRDGVGLRQLVDSLGQSAAPQARNAAYQANEEGEY